MARDYKAPDMPAGDVTPALVRDELLKCFESANGEFMDLMNMPSTEEQIRGQVRQFVTTIFQNCGVSFDDPTKQGIITAIDQCKANAESMMGDKGADVIRHHYAEMMKLVHKLP